MTKYLMAVGFWACLLFYSSAQNAPKVMDGIVLEAGSELAVSGCNILVFWVGQKSGYITRHDGRFAINLPENQKPDSISFSHINYHTKTIGFSQGEDWTIHLERRVYAITDVTIHSAYSDNNRGNKFVFTPLQAASSISIIGEPDVVRHISSLPGVSQGIEGTLGLFVRGSNNGSNRVEFNGVPLYAYSHLLGMFSAFSPEIIEKTTFRPGGIPAQFGNLSSSMLQISPKERFGSATNGKITLSPYMTGIYATLPIAKDKLSVQVAGRTSFMPWIINNAMKIQDNDDPDQEESMQMRGQVLDFTAIADWKLSQSNQLNFMLYTTNDYFDFKDHYSQNKMNLSALALKLGWVSQLSPVLKFEAGSYYSTTYSTQEQLYFDNWEPSKVKSQLRLGSELTEWSAMAHFKYSARRYFSINVGSNILLQEFMPASEKTIHTQDLNTAYTDKQTSNLVVGFADVLYANSGVLEVSLGYRHSIQEVQGNYRNNFDLRFLSDIFITQSFGLELSYDKLTQFYHVLEGLPTGWSLNIMIPSDNDFPEEVTNQYYGGAFFKTRMAGLKAHATAGAYYREMKNLVSYISTVNIFGFKDASWEDEIDTGKGCSYGLELAGSLQGEKFGTTVAYTLSTTNREYPQINNGYKFPFKFDRRHILNLQSKYSIAKSTNRKGHQREQGINTVLAFSSGHRVTMPVASYQGVNPPYWELRNKGLDFPIEVDNNAYHRQQMTARNGIKIKDYFRMDVAYTFTKHRPKSSSELAISFFNILNRKNPYLIFYEDNTWQQLSIAPIMPAIRWTKSF